MSPPPLDPPRSPVYVPTQLDDATVSKRALQKSPLRLFLSDTIILFKLLRYFPRLFSPRAAEDGVVRPYDKGPHSKELALQGLLFILEFILVIVVLPAFLVLPGFVFLLALIVSILLIKLIAWPLEGPGIVPSTTILTKARDHSNESWIYVNGCAAGYATLQRDVDCLAYIFGRKITGIHNRTYGLTADILECLIQRVFSYNTTDVRVAYEHIKYTVLDSKKSKVVLVGHSQGGIVLSLVLDQLFDELPAPLMSKIEVYTFGSAASHFSNPPISKEEPPSRNLNPPRQQLVIPYIEHYANEYDLVPRWGVLHSTQNILSNRYSGSVFVRMRASGHMFVLHYLQPMFSDVDSKEDSTQDSFLDQVVDVDEDTVRRREATALDVKRRESGLLFGDGERLVDGGESGPAIMSFSRTSSGRLMVEEAKGKTVRQLSRLWRYQGGRSPD